MTTLTIDNRKICTFQNLDQAKSFILSYMLQDCSRWSDMVYVEDNCKKLQALVGHTNKNKAFDSNTKIAYVNA